MVRVPVSQENRVQARPLPRERFQYSAPRNLVGPAMQEAGQALGRAAQDFDAIEATYDEADALRIENEFRGYERERLRTGQNAYLATKGFEAGNGMEPAVKDLREGAQNLLTSARSKRAADMARRALDQRVGASEETIARHSVAEMTSARIGQSEARIEGSLNDAVESYGTDQFAVHLGVVEMETAELGRLRGWSPEQTREQVEKASSAVHRSVADRLLVDDDVDGALEYLDAFKDGMRFDDEMAVRRALKPKVEFREAEGRADLIIDGLADSYYPAEPDPLAPTVPDTEIAYAHPLGSNIGPTVSGGEYGASRDGGARRHAGRDYAVPVGTPVQAPGDGEVVAVWEGGAGGLQMKVRLADGSEHGFAHLSRADIRKGRITKGQRIARTGDTGTGGPHLHYTVKVGGRNVDPAGYEPGKGRGVSQLTRDGSGRLDAGKAYERLDQIAEEQGWSPEDVERVRERISVRISRDDALRGREEAAQWDATLAQVDALGDDFTDVAKINGFANLPADRRLQLRNMAEANRKALETGPIANSDLAISLQVMAIEQPEEFARTDLREYKPMITPAEFESLRVKQSMIAAKPKTEVSIRSGISASIGYYATEDMKLTGKDSQDRKLRVMDSMESYLRSRYPDVREGKRAPSDAEFREAFQWSTAKVGTQDGWFSKKRDVMRFETPAYDVPRADRQRIITAYRRVHGRIPTQDELVEYYNDKLKDR